jgi:SAM-dependent methyltransferase
MVISIGGYFGDPQARGDPDERANMTGTSKLTFPFPPLDLLQRTGQVDPLDPERAYDQIGKGIRSIIEAMLPVGWSWKGRQVLDFGCGAGRVLRQFAPEAQTAEFWGCDIHAPSVAWIRANLAPHFQAVTCKEEPGLMFPDGYFSLVYAISVFSHLAEHATGWLLELRRILADEGLLMMTFLGEGMIQQIIGEPWDDCRIGFNTVMHGNSWDTGGPMTFISPWWIKAHWGRAFDIVELRPYTALAGDGKPGGHGLALLRKRQGQVSADEIDRLEPDEPRELGALRHNISQLREETTGLRARIAEWERR